MSKRPFEIECMGHKVSVIIDDDGIEFLGWDEEAEMAVQALGLDPSICWILAQAIENDQLDNLLASASDNGQAALVELLIDIGADVRADNDYALLLASINGHADVVQILLDAGADVHAEYDEALRWAARNGYADIVRILEAWIEEHG